MSRPRMLTPAQSRRRIAALRRAGHRVSVVTLPDGTKVVLKSRKRVRRARRNPAAVTQILTTVLAAGAAAVVTALITQHFARKSALKSVAKGETPLPKGATPTTEEKRPIVVPPKEEKPEIAKAEEGAQLPPAGTSGGPCRTPQQGFPCDLGLVCSQGKCKPMFQPPSVQQAAEVAQILSQF